MTVASWIHDSGVKGLVDEEIFMEDVKVDVEVQKLHERPNKKHKKINMTINQFYLPQP